MNIAVIGGGFSGLLYAAKLSKLGCNVTVLEEHRNVGYPKHCTGLVSAKTVKMIGHPAERCVIRKFERLKIYNSKLKPVLIKTNEPIYLLDRVCLERELYKEAVLAGAEIKLGVFASYSERGEIYYSGVKSNYDKVLIANGIQKTGHAKQSGLVLGVNEIYDLKDDSEISEISIMFDHSIASGFFNWALPERDGRILIGLGSNQYYGVIQRLERVKKIFLGNNTNARLVERYGGWINVSPPIREFVKGKLVFVGDAASLTKPLTGGGLFPNSLIASNITGRTCEDAIESLVAVSQKVADLLRKQQKLAKAIHDERNQKGLDEAINIFSSYKFENIAKYIDYDYHNNLTKVLLKSPSLLYNALRGSVKSRDLFLFGIKLLF